MAAFTYKPHSGCHIGGKSIISCFYPTISVGNTYVQRALTTKCYKIFLHLVTHTDWCIKKGNTFNKISIISWPRFTLKIWDRGVDLPIRVPPNSYLIRFNLVTHEQDLMCLKFETLFLCKLHPNCQVPALRIHQIETKQLQETKRSIEQLQPYNFAGMLSEQLL